MAGTAQDCDKRSMRVMEEGRGKWLTRSAPALVVLVAFVGSLSVAFAESDLDSARAALQEFEKSAADVTAAYQSGNAEAIEEKQRKAEARLTEARILFDKAQAGESGDVQVLREYAELLTRMGDTDLAAEVWERVTKITPEAPSAWLALGRALASVGHRHAKEADAALKQALELSASPAEKAVAHASLGRLYRQEGLYDLARQNYEEALALDPQSPQARVALALLGVREGKVRGCAETLAAVGNASPELMGQVPTLLDQYLTDFQQSGLTVADTVADHFAYAQLLVQANRLPEAIGPLERAVKVGANDYRAWNLLGSVRVQLGDKARARAAFERSLEIEPNQPRTVEALMGLGAETKAKE